MNIQNLKFPKKAQILFKPYRFKGLRGGRGSAKSHSVASYLLIEGSQQKHRILCTREFQASIKDSVHKLLVDKIDQLGLSYFYTVTDHSITGMNGTEFIFAGLRHSIQSIKSMEGITKTWLEEAQTISQTSLDILIPTIRAPGSEIIATFNPENEEDPIYQLLVVHPRTNSICVEMNWRDNPWFSDVLNQERLDCKALDTTGDDYDWIWEGKIRKISEACIFKGKFTIESFDTPERSRFYLGSDFGYAADPSTVVRSFIQDKKLYIDHEAYGHGIEIHELPALYDKIPDVRKWTIYGDSARPDTISSLRRSGFRIEPCIKGPGSVDDGIAYLKSFQQIIIHPRCIHTAKEFKNYSWKVDRVTKEILPIPVDDFNHIIDPLRYSLSKLIRNPGTSPETWAKLAG